jgi:hypothetical protein
MAWRRPSAASTSRPCRSRGRGCVWSSSTCPSSSSPHAAWRCVCVCVRGGGGGGGCCGRVAARGLDCCTVLSCVLALPHQCGARAAGLRSQPLLPRLQCALSHHPCPACCQQVLSLFLVGNLLTSCAIFPLLFGLLPGRFCRCRAGASRGMRHSACTHAHTHQLLLHACAVNVPCTLLVPAPRTHQHTGTFSARARLCWAPSAASWA